MRHQWLGVASLAVALIHAPAAEQSAPFQEPKVFTSSDGVLDLLMLAKPMPVATIVFDPRMAEVPSIRSARSPWNGPRLLGKLRLLSEIERSTFRSNGPLDLMSRAST